MIRDRSIQIRRIVLGKLTGSPLFPPCARPRRDHSRSINDYYFPFWRFLENDRVFELAPPFCLPLQHSQQNGTQLPLFSYRPIYIIVPNAAFLIEKCCWNAADKWSQGDESWGLCFNFWKNKIKIKCDGGRLVLKMAALEWLVLSPRNAWKFFIQKLRKVVRLKSCDIIARINWSSSSHFFLGSSEGYGCSVNNLIVRLYHCWF